MKKWLSKNEEKGNFVGVMEKIIEGLLKNLVQPQYSKRGGGEVISPSMPPFSVSATARYPSIFGKYSECMYEPFRNR